jgi:hypothetical protein
MNERLKDLRRRTPPFADRLLKPLLNYLLIARRCAAGDLDLHIILMAIAIRTVQHPDFARLTEQERLEKVDIFPTLGINARSISESSGIPRETTRRKVAELVKRGWVARRGSNLHFTAQALANLMTIREAREQLAFDYYELIRDEIGEPPAEKR